MSLPVLLAMPDHSCHLLVLVCRRVGSEDVSACEDRFNKSKMVHSIMRHVAETTGEDLEVSCMQ